MKNPLQLTRSIDSVKDSLDGSAWRRGFLLIPLVLASFALSPAVRAVDPPPDGGYVHENTAEGEDALFSLDANNELAHGNTAIGWHGVRGDIGPIHEIFRGLNDVGSAAASD